MNDQKWEEIKDNIKNKFEVLEEKTEDILYKDRIRNKDRKIGDREIIEFSSPLGNLKVVREKKLAVVDKKHHYHKTKADAVVEFVFAENEYSDNVKVFKKEGERWLEMKAEGIL